uniref:Uncharacterized protein n=1 Tax=Heliothis virescens TaxID=7102 RepID=A0A2A4K2V3_HELVI
MLIHLCTSLEVIDLSNIELPSKSPERAPVKYEEYKPIKLVPRPIRRYWLLNSNNQNTKGPPIQRVYEDEKDSNIKQKIANLVEHTMNDTRRKLKSTDKMREAHRTEAAYKAGFILSMIKKSKNVLDELFNVAVKHRDDWAALEQLKIFELIMHTNVDTTNLLRQLVDVHVKYMNATSDKKRVILLYWLVNEKPPDVAFKAYRDDTPYEEEADANLKAKISTLVNQTMHDTQRKLKSVEPLKDKYRDLGPYRAGFVLSLIKKSRDVLNELFNVAVKHRDEWKALEQLKIFELIVHTNVDTTNLLRQLVEIHLTHMNSTQGMKKDKRVLLI